MEMSPYWSCSLELVTLLFKVVPAWCVGLLRQDLHVIGAGQEAGSPGRTSARLRANHDTLLFEISLGFKAPTLAYPAREVVISSGSAQIVE